MNNSSSGFSFVLIFLFIFLILLLPPDVSMLALKYVGIILIAAAAILLGIYVGIKISFKYIEAFKRRGIALCVLNALLLLVTYILNPFVVIGLVITTKAVTSLWFIIFINLPLAMRAQKKLDAEYEALSAKYKTKPSRSILKIY